MGTYQYQIFVTLKLYSTVSQAMFINFSIVSIADIHLYLIAAFHLDIFQYMKHEMEPL